MLDVQQKAESMGLTFKPSKFRSLSIQAGKVTDTKFFLLAGNGSDKVYLKTMEDDPHTFLGSNITERNTPADHFDFLKDKLEVKLVNLDKTLVRGEYKLAVYSRYILPSLQFHFSVHSIHKTHLEILDGMARNFLKCWLSFPSRGVTDLGIFHPGIIGLKYPSQVYLEAHVSSFISLKLSDDPVVKEAISCQLQREGAWKKKSSTALECLGIFEKIGTDISIPTTENCDDFNAAKRLTMKNLKKAGKAEVANKYKQKARVKSNELEVQGQLASLLEEEKTNMA